MWKQIDLPKSECAVLRKCVFNMKNDANGVVTKHKECVIVRCFDQQAGIDFHKTFAPMVCFSSLMIFFWNIG